MDCHPSLPVDRGRRHPSPSRDPQSAEAKQDYRPRQVHAVADQEHRTQAAGTKQPRGFARILERVARPRLDQQRPLGHPASPRRAAHDLGFGDRSRTAARQHQKRGNPLLEKLDPVLYAPLQRRRRSAPENDDGVDGSRSMLAHSARTLRAVHAERRRPRGAVPARRRPSGAVLPLSPGWRELRRRRHPGRLISTPELGA
jgi:hypothetical protein